MVQSCPEPDEGSIIIDKIKFDNIIFLLRIHIEFSISFTARRIAMDWSQLSTSPDIVGGQVEVQNFPLVTRAPISGITIEKEFVVVRKEWTAQLKAGNKWVMVENEDLRISIEESLLAFGLGRFGIIIPRRPMNWAITFFPKTYHKHLRLEDVGTDKP